MITTIVAVPAGEPICVCSIGWDQPGQAIQNTGDTTVYLDTVAAVSTSTPCIELAPDAVFTMPGQGQANIGVYALSPAGDGQVTLLTAAGAP